MLSFKEINEFVASKICCCDDKTSDVKCSVTILILFSAISIFLASAASKDSSKTGGRSERIDKTHDSGDGES